MRMWIAQFEILGYKILMKSHFMGKIWNNMNLCIDFFAGNLILHSVSFAFCEVFNNTTPCISMTIHYYHF